MTPADLPVIATRVWRDRHAVASDLVSRGQWSARDADRRLLLIAIPCLLAGADAAAFPSDMRDELASLRKGVRYPGAIAFTRGEAETRELFATLHASPLEWGQELGEAAARALTRAERLPGEENRQLARDLATLCRALHVTIPALPAAAPERKAA